MLKSSFLYNEISSALMTDGYHITTPAIFYNSMRNPEKWKVANLTLRGDAESVSYTVIAGIWEILTLLEKFVIDEEVQAAFREKGVPERIIQKMAGRKFEGRIYAVRDGEVMFTGPVIRIEGPRWQVKWVESMFTNHLRRCSSVATKAARVTSVVDVGDKTSDSSFRRTNDTDGTFTARSAYLGGIHGTSNVLAGRMFNIPWGGTVDHYTIQDLMEEFFEQNPKLETTFENMREAQKFAFRCIIETYPENFLLLVDTIGGEIGIEDAVEILSELRPKGYAIRIDSGDLVALTKYARKLLDKAGLQDVEISPSGGLSALNVQLHKQNGGEGSIFGFGEYFQYNGERARHGATVSEFPVNVEMVSKNSGSVDGMFELMKLSDNPAKNSLPGIHQRMRMLDENGMFAGDVIVNLNDFELDENIREGKLGSNVVALRRQKKGDPIELNASKGSSYYIPMQLVFENGKMLDSVKSLYELEASRAYCAEQMARLPEACKAVDGTHAIYPVGVEKSLYKKAERMGRDKTIVHRNVKAA